jgi:hypothetical protein
MKPPRENDLVFGVMQTSLKDTLHAGSYGECHLDDVASVGSHMDPCVIVPSPVPRT